MERLSMRKIKEVLRLKFELNMSERQISKSTQTSKGTISNYLKRFIVSGLSWPLPPTLSEADIEARLFPPKPALPDALRPTPDWAQMHLEMRRKGVTLFLLWQEHKSRHPEGFNYSWFCEHYRSWAGKLDVVMRQEHLAGEKCFVDYAGHTMPVIDRGTGEVLQAQIFVGVMGVSNYTFAEATWSQTLPDWIGSHVRMLEHFGASPEILVPDNLKSGVSKACRYEPDLNPSYLAFANFYSIAVIPARSRKPRDKAKVENGVLIVERWILACLRNRSFFSLMELLAIRLSEQTTLAKSLVMAELNGAIGELLVKLNQRPFKKIPGCRETMFRSVDYPAMRSLPLDRYVFTEWKKVRVNIDYHVEVDERYYSVPYTLLGKQLDACFSEYVVEVLHKGERVASHARLPANGKRYSTLTAHMPKGHQEMAEWTPERIVNWATTVGENTSKLVDALIKRKPHPQQAFRAAMGIFRLGKRYGNDRVEAACRRAYATNAINYSSVESILKHRLDELPLPQDSKQTSLPIFHDNVRGAGYYH
jgi:transposase